MADYGTIGYSAFQFTAGFLVSPIPYGGPYFAPQYNDAEPVDLNVRPLVGRLESALIIRLRGDKLRWEASLDESADGFTVSMSGSLTTTTQGEQFDHSVYVYRDRQLAYRDMMVAAAVADVSAQVSDVWNYPAPMPYVEGPAPRQLPEPPASYFTLNGTTSLVSHVLPSSVPFYGISQTDLDLYGRDSLVYELLARAAGTVFSDPPIARIDSFGTLFPDTDVWSLAQGSRVRREVNVSQQLDVSQIKVPDQHLAHRDNIVAYYASQVIRALQNPFEYAIRLYVEVTGVNTREPEVYTLAVDSASERVWIADPALESRNRITYDKTTKTLLWARETLNLGHVPQIYAFAIPGIDAGQQLVTVPDVPAAQDAQFWRSKASFIVPEGGSISDQIVVAETRDSASINGGLMQVSGISLSVPGTLAITLPDAIDVGRHRIALLVNPNPVVEIAGIQNTSGINGTLGGVDYEVDVQSGDIGLQTYIVDGGLGIVYNSVTYADGATFDGVPSVTTFTQVSASNPSKIRLAAVSWSMALPPGYWDVSFDYTNLQYETTGFGVTAEITLNGGIPTEAIKDAVPQPFTGVNGDVVTSSVGSFEVTDTSPMTVRLLWTSGTGQFHVRQLNLTNTDVTTCRIHIDGTLSNGTATVDVTGKPGQPETVLFELDTSVQNPAVLQLTTFGDPDAANLLPLQIKQVTVQNVGTYTATPNAAGFQSWRQECVDRAERAVRDAHRRVLSSYGTNLPVFYSAGTAWDRANTDTWMALIETTHPRLRQLDEISPEDIFPGRQYEVVSGGTVTYESGTHSVGDVFYAVNETGTYSGNGTVQQIGAFQRSNPGHIGRPCLVPYGLQLNGVTPELAVAGSHAMPVVASCQPWMIDAGLYVVQPEFWLPDMV